MLNVDLSRKINPAGLKGNTSPCDHDIALLKLRLDQHSFHVGPRMNRYVSSVVMVLSALALINVGCERQALVEQDRLAAFRYHAEVLIEPVEDGVYDVTLTFQAEDPIGGRSAEEIRDLMPRDSANLPMRWNRKPLVLRVAPGQPAIFLQGGEILEQVRVGAYARVTLEPSAQPDAVELSYTILADSRHFGIMVWDSGKLDGRTQTIPLNTPTRLTASPKP